VPAKLAQKIAATEARVAAAIPLPLNPFPHRSRRS